ncbi:hypothetical protein QLX08_001910 [Tetragonisca angustula]|uniref:Uncharacterized protein n=1 Tax=Tetragonisca angustula TaxID=166442 RepID=A0AAW1AGC7_9HYME
MRGRARIPFQDGDNRGESTLSSRGVAPRRRLEVSFLGQRLVEEGALFAALDVHIYHPLLLHGQTSGLAGHVRRPGSHYPTKAALAEESRFAEEPSRGHENRGIASPVQSFRTPLQKSLGTSVAFVSKFEK